MSHLHWKTEDVCRWLEAVSLGEHRPVFHRLAVTGADLPNIDTNFMISELRIDSPIQQAELRRALDGLLGPEAAGTATTMMRRSVPARVASELTLGGGAEPLIQISAQSLLDEGCRHSGWLRKRGINIKSWKRRYHVLKQGCIYYFRDELAKSARGQFSLNNYRAELCEGVTSLPWAFQLVNSDITKRTWYLVASSEHERRTWMEKIEQDIAEFCAPGTVPRPLIHSDVFSDDEGGLTEDQVVNEMYATAFDDSTPFDPSENREPPPVSSRGKSLDQRLTPEAIDSMKPPRNDLLPLQPIHQTSRPNQKQTLRSNHKDRNPPPLPGQANEAIYAKPQGEDSGSDSDAYLRLIDDEDEPEAQPIPSQVSQQSDKAPTGARTKKGLAGAIKMLPSLPMSAMPLKPAPYRAKARDESPADPVKKPIPTPRSKQGPPTLPPKDSGNSDSDEESIPSINQNPKTFQHVDRDRADEMLRSRLTDGLYLFRESANAGSEKVLSVWIGDRCRHYKVFYLPMVGYSLIKGAVFPSLWELVEHYKHNLLPKSNYTLRRSFVG